MQCSAVSLVYVLKQHSLTMGTNNLDPYRSDVESNLTVLSVLLGLIWSSD